VSSSPAIGSDGTVYVGSNDKKLYAINGKSGVKLWEFETGGYVVSSPAIGSDGTVYVGSHSGRLYAINGKSGIKLWEFETEYSLPVDSSPAIGSDGTVYVGSSDGLYAIKADSKGLAKSPWPMRGQNPLRTGRDLKSGNEESTAPPPVLAKKPDDNLTGTITNPDDDYKTSPEFKAKVDNYFGTGDAIVRLFVVTGGKLTPFGKEMPMLFSELSKDLLNAEPTVGLPGSIEVYQPRSTNGLNGLMWKPADPRGLASSGVELMYSRNNDNSGGISIVGVPEWPALSTKTEIGRKLHDNKIKDHYKKRFTITVKKNTAIRVKTAGKTEIIYILYKPGIFFDGLFDEAVNKPKGSGLTKLAIDPYLMNRLNQRVLYKGTITPGLVMVVPESVHKAGNLPSMLVLNQPPPEREWVTYMGDLDNYINVIRNPPFRSHKIYVQPNKSNPTNRSADEWNRDRIRYFPRTRRWDDEYLFLIGPLFQGNLFSGAKITVTPSNNIRVTEMRSGQNSKPLERNPFENYFWFKKDITKAAPFYCWVGSKNPTYKVNPQENISIRIELSDPQKKSQINKIEIDKKKRQDAFKEALKVDTTLFYYKSDTNGAGVIRFNRKK
jgi:hypothetical protein